MNPGMGSGCFVCRSIGLLYESSHAVHLVQRAQDMLALGSPNGLDVFVVRIDEHLERGDQPCNLLFADLCRSPDPILIGRSVATRRFDKIASPRPHRIPVD